MITTLYRTPVRSSIAVSFDGVNVVLLRPAVTSRPLARKRFIAHFLPSPRRRFRSPAVPWSCSLPCRLRPPLALKLAVVIKPFLDHR